jgi:hypothetical protein
MAEERKKKIFTAKVAKVSRSTQRKLAQVLVTHSTSDRLHLSEVGSQQVDARVLS